MLCPVLVPVIGENPLSLDIFIPLVKTLSAASINALSALSTSLNAGGEGASSLAGACSLDSRDSTALTNSGLLPSALALW